MKRFFLFCLFTLILLLLFRGQLYRMCITYKAVGDRSSIPLIDTKLKSSLDEWSLANESPSVEDLIYFVQKQTAHYLHFVNRQAETNPNLSYKTGATNCVGYSKMAQAMAQYLIDKQALNLKAKHKLGKLHVLGYDIHQWIDDPFWANHDYNEIVDLQSKQIYAFDPTLYDYLRVAFVGIKE